MTIVVDLERKLSDIADALPVPRQYPGAFSVEAFVAEIVSAPKNLKKRGRELTALQRKIEVARRLSAFYSPDMKRRVGDNDVHPDFALALCAVYLAIDANSGDPTALNTALKMIDGILVAPIVPPDAFLSGASEELVARVKNANA